MDKHELVKLCSRSWSLTALGLMADGVPGRTSPLAAAAGCGRTAMNGSISHLVDLGLLERNPGYGHPLRPEFRLTANGEDIAKWASTLVLIVQGRADRRLLRSKWSLPLISCLPKETRYSDLRRQLFPVSDRALSLCLGQLTERHWISRQVSAEKSPPAVSYHLSGTGSTVHRHLNVISLG